MILLGEVGKRMPPFFFFGWRLFQMEDVRVASVNGARGTT